MLVNMLSRINYFISTLIYFYSIIIVLRIFLTWLPSIDWEKQPVKFIRIISDAYLDIFRRFIPPMGGLDFSPIIALLFLNILQMFFGR